MPAVKCDSDHTQPYDQGGRTCECNTGPQISGGRSSVGL
jgi:hypothetical protein